MTKKYIILASAIINMGGGQMYINNKAMYMSEQGWTPIVFSYCRGPIVIPNLRKYKQNIFEEMESSPLVYLPNQQKKIIDRMIDKIGNFEEAVIESSDVWMALWGEILAQKLNCKHMVHLLGEHNDQDAAEEYLDFFRFKHARRELSGIGPNSLKMLFRYSADIKDENSYYLPSLCGNVVVDTEEDPYNLPTYGITLGCIGRLTKEYVMVAATSFKQIAERHPNENFNFLFVGGSSNKVAPKNIKKMFAKCKNVKLIMLGAVYPIPSSLFAKVSVFISAAGSARVSYRNNCTTISIDVCDLKAIGVLGYTTKNTTYREAELAEDPTDLLEKILFQNYLADMPYEEAKPFSLALLQSHVDFLNLSQTTKEYFDVEKLQISKRDKKRRAFRILFGAKGHIRIHTMISKLLKKIRSIRN